MVDFDDMVKDLGLWVPPDDLAKMNIVEICDEIVRLRKELATARLAGKIEGLHAALDVLKDEGWIGLTYTRISAKITELQASDVLTYVAANAAATACDFTAEASPTGSASHSSEAE